MAGVKGYRRTGMVSKWGEGGTRRIYSAWRERVDVLSRFKIYLPQTVQGFRRE